MNWIDEGALYSQIGLFLREDLGRGDITTQSLVARNTRARARFVAGEKMIVAGLEAAEEVFLTLDSQQQLEAFVSDGEEVDAGKVIARMVGFADVLISAERVALNLLQRLSGIATLTRQFVDAAGGRIVVLDTRKTTPILRALEKYAVRAGGGVNLRSGLDDGILIKDNHIRLAGGVGNAVTRMRKTNREMPTEVEAQTLAEVDEALQAGAEIVLLDNLSTGDIIEAVKRCRGRARTEISGGVTLQRMGELAATGANYVSVGALTHSAPAADISFEIEPA